MPKASEENAFVYLKEDNERSKSNFSSAKRTMSGGEKVCRYFRAGADEEKNITSLYSYQNYYKISLPEAQLSIILSHSVIESSRLSYFFPFSF